MRKIFLPLIVLTPLYSFAADDTNTTPVGNADFITVMNEMRKYDGPIIATGSRGDTLVQIYASDELVGVYKRNEKTAMFLSTEDPNQYVKPETCLINIIGYDISKEWGGGQNCNWRLFCGNEIKYDGTMYAVELCGDMVADN